jgi:hypothetical protein
MLDGKAFFDVAASQALEMVILLRRRHDDHAHPALRAARTVNVQDRYRLGVRLRLSHRWSLHQGNDAESYHPPSSAGTSFFSGKLRTTGAGLFGSAGLHG